MRIVLFALVISRIACAQFQEFATTGNGDRLYFSSSLVLRGSNAPAQGRIYRADASGVQLYREQTAVFPDQPPSPTPGLLFSNYYQLSRPQVSRDGSVVAITASRTCGFSGYALSCRQSVLRQTTITGLPGGGDITVPGAGVLSGNGRHLFIYDTGEYGGGTTSLVNLETGVTLPLPFLTGPPTLGVGRVVADDGTLVCSVLGVIYMAHGRAVTSIGRTPISGSEAVIDSAASTIVYAFNDAYGRWSVRRYRIADGLDQQLAGDLGTSPTPSLSANGTRVMFLSKRSGSTQIWIMNADGTSPRQITSDPWGILSATMSDDGSTAWYMSNTGRLLQLNLATGVAGERIAPTAAWGEVTPFASVPGSILMQRGVGFSDTALSANSYPLPHTLAGVTVTIDGLTVPLLSVTPTAITFQIPWELASKSGSTLTENVQPASSTSPFVSSLDSSLSIVATGGFVVPAAASSTEYGTDALTVHQDWSALVDATHPARPGEIVHVYATGLGSVTSPPATGMPSPSNPLATTTAVITCWTYVAGISKVTVPVLFSGLAPGLVGYYQLDIQVPTSYARADFQFNCDGVGSEFYGSFNVAL